MAKAAPLPREVVLIDTSVLTNVLPVPGKAQHRPAVMKALEVLIPTKPVLLMPLVVLFETGNHIGHLPDGRQRRETAVRFVETVHATVQGKAPWRAIRSIALNEIADWLDAFPDAAARGQGLGDLSIVKEWEQACDLYPHHRVRIWSLDDDLQGYDRRP